MKAIVAQRLCELQRIETATIWLVNELVFVALLSSAGAALVGISSAMATIFGPAWRERNQREADIQRAQAEVRYAQTLEFVDALSSAALNSVWHDTVVLHMARTKFVSTLRAGEGAIERYSASAIRWVLETNQAPKQLERADAVGDLIFGWLRGEVTILEVEDALQRINSEIRDLTSK